MSLEAQPYVSSPQMTIPLFASSDIDSVEMEQMASQVEDAQYSKNSVIAKIGQLIVPALYFIRSGSVRLSDGKTTKLLKSGEIFAFGSETLLLTQSVKNQPSTFREDGFIALVAQARGYLGEAALKANSVSARHDVLVSEDAKLGRLTLVSMATVLYDITRLGQGKNTLDDTITKDTLKKHQILGAGTFGQVWLTTQKKTKDAYALKIQYKRELIEYGQAKGVIREKEILARMRHPFVSNIVNAE
jgi:hypothetical protein